MLVSILLVTHNRSTSLEQTLANILKQSFRDFEIVIIDDASTDNTKQVVDSVKLQFNTIQYYKNPQNLGLQKSLNLGLSYCRGKYIARIDDHDLWIDSNKLQKQVSFLTENPTYGLVGTGLSILGKEVLNPETDAQIRQQILFRCPFCHVSMMYKRELIQQVNGYDEQLEYGEDWDLWCRLGRLTKMYNFPEVMVEVNAEEGLSYHFKDKQHRYNFSMIRQYKAYYPKHYLAFLYHIIVITYFSLVPRAGRLHWIFHKLFQKTFH